MSGRDVLVAAMVFAALAATAQASAEPLLSTWLGAALIVFAAAGLLQRPRPELDLTPISAAVFGYAGWLVVTNLWSHPYTPAASYDAAFLVGGFLMGWRAGREHLTTLWQVALAFALCLSLWSLAQVALGGSGARGEAIFAAPATLATVLNFVLAPGLVLLATGNRNRWLLAALMVIAAGELATQSRGGWLALVASLLVAFLLLRRAGAHVGRAWLRITAAAFVVAIVLGAFSWRTASESGAARIELYKATLDALRDWPWLTGDGYLSFRYVLHAARPSIPAFHRATTEYVHDDYLQALLDSGVPGALLLLFLAIAPALCAWRALAKAPPAERTTIVALVAAMIAMAVHALADFPFYVASCLVMYGACAGMLGALLAKEKAVPAAGRVRQVVRASIAGFILLLIVKPALAEAAVEYAYTQWNDGRGERAAYWFELARRLESADWRYHTYAGEFWFAQAQGTSNASAARLADRLFQEGLAAQPREVSNLVWRISTHIYLRELLAEPADAATLRAWADRASALAPFDPGVQFHRYLVARFEAQAGR